MFHISIFVLRNSVMGSISDPVDVFEHVNAFFKVKEKDPPFQVELVGFSQDVKCNGGKYIIRPDVVFADVKKTDLFKYYYPSVTLVDEKVITDQDGLYSSGASNSYWNLLMHLVEKYTNRETAIRTAKYFVVDLDKNNQSPFIIFQGLKDHEDEIVLKAQYFIEQNHLEKMKVEQIADHLYVARRTFERRFK